MQAEAAAISAEQAGQVSAAAREHDRPLKCIHELA